MLIRGATLMDGTHVDIRCVDDTITAMAPRLSPVVPAQGGQEQIVDADGGAVLPGLHDHHLHLFALAASLASVDCGLYRTPAALAGALRLAARPGQWLRAINYHEDIAGQIDRSWLDAVVPAAPVRVQHRSGRLWVLNGRALAAVAGDVTDSPLELEAGVPTGRLYDGDAWLRGRVGSVLPDLGGAARRLAENGITAFTDATPGNGRAFFQAVGAAQAAGAIAQRVAVMGTLAIAAAPRTEQLFPYALKVHLHEGDYPAPERFIAQARQARASGLIVAVHCVTVADLVFALSLLQEAGVGASARIEHAALVPQDLLPALAESGVTVVTQPNFVAERGDSYVRDIAQGEHAALYRCRSLVEAGIRVGGGTDAPFGHFSPWAAMQAAVTRRTRAGCVLGGAECLSPEAALALFTTRLGDPGGRPRQVAPGQRADLCVLTQPWRDARDNLARVKVRMTVARGRPIHQGDGDEMTWEERRVPARHQAGHAGAAAMAAATE